MEPIFDFESDMSLYHFVFDVYADSMTEWEKRRSIEYHVASSVLQTTLLKMMDDYASDRVGQDEFVSLRSMICVQDTILVVD